MTGTVVSMSERTGAAFVDCGVARNVGLNRGGGKERVVGMLRFEDMGEGLRDAGGEEVGEEGEAEIGEEEEEFEPLPWDEGDDEGEEEENDGREPFGFVAPAVEEEGGGDLQEEDAEQLQKLTVPSLKEECRERGLKVGGNKGELVARLLEARDGEDDGDEEDGEETVTDMDASVDEEGVISYVDDETGEKVIVGNVADIDLEGDDDDEDSLDSGDEEELEGLEGSERLEAIAKMLLAEGEEDSGSDQEEEELPESLGVGDVVTCYVKSTSPQSGRFTLTLDSRRSSSNREEKMEREANKKMEKLGKMEGFEEWMAMEGDEKTGTVVAASADSRWLYISVPGIPVAVCENPEKKTLEKGEQVAVRMGGVDEERGQLRVVLA